MTQKRIIPAKEMTITTTSGLTPRMEVKVTCPAAKAPREGNANNATKPKRKKNPDNPSPSGDPWFDDPRNIAIVMEGIKSAKEEKCESVEESPVLSAIFSKYR